MDTRKIKNWMRANVEDYRDPATGEINSTGLAEGAADACDAGAELDDETSEIWELALAVAEREQVKGCGTATHVAGTNGGRVRCGAAILWLPGERELHLCAACEPATGAAAGR